jgi:hypothetical protein
MKYAAAELRLHKMHYGQGQTKNSRVNEGSIVPHEPLA